MLYKTFGRTGIKVSAFSLGSWITFDRSLKKSKINDCMSYAFDQGVNLFDTAEVYGEGKVESIMGKALKELQLPRDAFTLCTKVFWGGAAPTQMGLHRKHIIEGCNNSLKRLSADYIDFYLCHRPDPYTPIEETVIAMNLLINQGKILYWGTSEWPNHLIIEAYHVAKAMNLVPPSIEQFQYNLFYREKGEKVIPEICEKIGLGTMVTMPLASGILAGRYNHNIPTDSRANLASYPYFKDVLTSEEGQAKLAKAKKMEIIAKELNVSQAQLALAWCLLNPNMHTTLLGASSLSQLEQNLASLKFINNGGITAPMLEAIESIFQNKPIPNYEPSYEEVISGS